MPEIVFKIAGGTIESLWQESIPMGEIAEGGRMDVTRASSIEWSGGLWRVEIAGEVVFSHPSRNVCLEWEHDHINRQLAE